MTTTNGAPALTEFAPAKVNLTLAVGERRADGYHGLDSLVAFASFGDELSLTPGSDLSLSVAGDFSSQAGDDETNLVLSAARALARRLPGLAVGAFALRKHVPVGAGLGGGSADAAAALRLLARTNGLAFDHPALAEAAVETGSDVPVCLAGGCRMMSGRGEVLGRPLPLPALACVLVHPGKSLATGRVFQALAAHGTRDKGGFAVPAGEASSAAWLAAIATGVNHLEAPAIALAPVIAAAREALAGERGCRIARMTGSGAAVFGLFADGEAAAGAAERLGAANPAWWVRAVTLG